MDAHELAEARTDVEAWMLDRATLTRPAVAPTKPGVAPGPTTTLATGVACTVWRLSGRLVEDLEKRGVTAAWGVRLPHSAPTLRDGDRIAITAGNAAGRTFTVVDVLGGRTIELTRAFACVERS